MRRLHRAALALSFGAAASATWSQAAAPTAPKAATEPTRTAQRAQKSKHTVKRSLP